MSRLAALVVLLTIFDSPRFFNAQTTSTSSNLAKESTKNNGKEEILILTSYHEFICLYLYYLFLLQLYIFSFLIFPKMPTTIIVITHPWLFFISLYIDLNTDNQEQKRMFYQFRAGNQLLISLFVKSEIGYYSLRDLLSLERKKTKCR